MSTTAAGLTRASARWAIAQSGVAEMHGVLAYAEALAVIAAGITVAVEPPERLVRRMVTATLRGDRAWAPREHTFPAHLRKATRLEVAGRFTLHARMRGRGPALWEARLGEMQLGDLRGIEQLAHWAGEMMVHVRSNDAAMLAAAIKLADYVRGRLQPWAGEPDDEDTARLTRGVPAAVEDSGSN